MNIESNTFKFVRANIVELIGTFSLTFVVLVTLTENGFYTPVMAAMTLGIFVYTIGNTSGCHINPAITVAATLIRKISPQKAACYIVMQLLGAYLAKLLALAFLSGVAIWLKSVDTAVVGTSEMFGSIIFAFGVAAVMMGSVNSALSGIVVGGSLFLGIAISAHDAYGLLNPAVALGTGAISLAYAIGPTIGASLGMLIYRWVVYSANA